MTATQETRRSLLASLFTPTEVRAHLLAREAWQPYPTASDRAAWEQLPADTRTLLVTQAEAHHGLAWPELPATLFMEYGRDGNRSRYEERHFARRHALTALVLGECVEGQGRFLDDISNGVWALGEESFWGVPAHSFSPNFPGTPLPDTSYRVVDLFAAETGALLAWTHYLLGPRLAAVTPVLTDRIAREAQERILRPYREIDTWWWFGQDPHRTVNNWNPWINSNVLTVNLLLEPDAAQREATVRRAITSLDAFLNVYHDDGGCDEGTSYWGRAGASLFDCLDLLSSASGGKLDAFQLPLVREIGRYIYRMHIGDSWYVNFADGGAKAPLESELVYRYGQRIGDPLLMAQGASALGRAPRRPNRAMSLGRLLPALFDTATLDPDTPPPLVREAWLPGIAVLTAREAAGRTAGLFLAAKGGHNAESHNHNDVGNFIVALDGHPVLIDIGVETYTRKTFSAQRYDIWTMQSAYHNLPVIDGHQQSAGRACQARDVAADLTDDHAQLTLDLAPAYPAEAGVRRWQRTVRLERGAKSRIVLVDDYDLARAPGSLTLHLIASGAVDASQPGVLRCASPTRDLLVHYDARTFSPTVEEIDITDARLQPVWGERIYRVILAAREPQQQGAWTLTIVPASSDVA